MIIEVDKADIKEESVHCQYDIIRKLTYQRVDKPMNIMELKSKLMAAWRLQNIEFTHLGRGFDCLFRRYGTKK